jgi:hypothetical protein
MSSIELEQARDADRALKQIGAAVDGLTNQLLVDFAPAIVATAEQVKALAQSADEIKAPFAEFATQSRLVAQDVAQSFAALDRYVIETFGGWGSDGRDAAEFISDAFRNLPANIKAMVELGTVELLTLVEKAQAYGIAIDKYLNPQNWLNGSWGSIGEELDKALGQVDQTRLASITGVLDERQRILEAYDIEQQADRQAASLKQLENNARAFTASLATSTAQQQASTTTSQAATQQASQQAQALEALRQGVDPLRAAHADYTDNLAVLNRALADGTIGQQEYVEAVRWAAQQYQEAATGAAAQSQRLDELARQYDGQHQRAQRLEQAVADLNAAYRAGDISGAQYQRMLANVRDEMARTAQDADPLAQEMARAWDEAANRIDETFASAFQGAFDSFDDFSGQLLDGFKTLLAELAYQATLKPIVVGITSDVQGALGLPGQGGASTSSGLGQLSSLGSSLSVGGLQTAGNAYRAFAGTGSTYGGQFGASLAATGNGGLASGINSLAASGLGSAALGVGGGLAGGYLGTQAGESLFGKQANSNYGALAGAALGQTFIPIPGVGAALGGFAGGALDSLFGSDREYGFRFAQRAENPKAAGVDAGYDTDPRYGWYSSGGYQNGDLGRGRSTAFGSYGFLSKEVAEPDDLIAFLDSLETLDNTIAGALDDDQIARIKDELNGYYYKGDSLQRVLRERLDIIVDQSNSAFEASLERLGGDVETQVQALVSSLRVDDLGTGMAASVADEIDAQFRQALASGDSQIIAAAADRLASAAQAVQVLGDSAERLSLQFDAAASGALSAADNVAQLVGGMDSLSALQSRYFEAFYSDDEQLEALGQALREQFDALGLALPQTRTGVRDLVEGIDLMTEAGQRQYATVLEMVPSLERYVQQMQQQGQVTQQQTAALREQQGIAKSVALGRVARSAFEALEQSVQQEKEVLQ